MERDNKKIIYIVKRLFFIYRKFLFKKKLTYFLKYYTNTMHIIYQKKFGITMKQEIIHNRLFNDSKIKQKIINELNIKYSQLEGVKYTFIPTINKNYKIKTPKNKKTYNSCIMTPSIKKKDNFNKTHDKLNSINNDTVQQNHSTKNKTSQNFYFGKYNNDFNTFNSIYYTNYNNMNNYNNNNTNKLNRVDISLKKQSLNNNDVFNFMNNINNNKNVNSSVYNNIIKNKLETNNSKLYETSTNNNISNFCIKSSNSVMNRNKKNSSLKKYNTPPKLNQICSSFSERKDKEKNLIEITKESKKNKKISLNTSNNIPTGIKNLIPTITKTNNNEEKSSYSSYKEKLPNKKEYFYSFRNGQIPLTSFNTTSNIKANTFNQKNLIENNSLMDRIFPINKNFETSNVNNVNKNILKNLYLNNYNKKIYRLNNTKNIYSHISSTENSSNTFGLTNNNSRQNKNSDKSYKIKLLGKKNSSMSSINNFSKSSEASNKTNQSQRNFVQNKSSKKIPHRKNENIANKQFKNDLHNENNLTLQSISDSKMMEMANYYIEEDESMDDFAAKKVVFEKKNKANKKNKKKSKVEI